MAPTPAEITRLVAAARAAFDEGITQSLAWRVTVLDRLASALRAHERSLLDALAADLGRPAAEAWLAEIAVTSRAIAHTRARVHRWVRPRRVRTPLVLRPGRAEIVPQPLGVVCVVAPWNYPVQLSLMPLVDAVAAGNAVVLKPSERAPAASAALAALVRALDDPAIAVVEGGAEQARVLLRERFDHILFTGSATTARDVMRAAAEHLTPVTLELGGKSPAIVSRHADLAVTARRLVWGKFVNAGQTCIAPDYVLVDRAVHDQLVAALVAEIGTAFGPEPRESPDFGRLVDAEHVQRVARLIDAGTVVAGGEVDAAGRYIAPTVLVGVDPASPVMQEEVFGPVLPVLAVDDLDAAAAFVAARDKPLALYCFTDRADEAASVLARTSSGGACVNGTLVQIGHPELPFGGVGASGTGAYHGRFGFETFSHLRPVLHSGTRPDLSLARPPYTAAKQRWLRRLSVLAGPRMLWGRMRR